MPDKPQQEIVVALAGPAVNLAIAIVLALALRLADRNATPVAFGSDLAANLLIVNVLMLLFNLVPAFPMDGGRVLRALLALRMPFLKATRIASIVGQAIAIVFAAGGFFSGNFMLVFVALFVFLAASEENTMVRTRSTLSGLPARAAMLTDFDVLEATAPLQQAVDLLMAGSQEDFPVVENGEPIGILTRADLFRALQTHGPASLVGEVVDRNAVKADPHEPLEDVFQRMREHQRSALPVVSRGGLVGLLTLENVSELLLVQDALRRHGAQR
jgi:CBS domain-containing protein